MAQKELPGHEWRTLTCAHCGQNIRVLVDCKNRFCPECSPRRSARIAARLTWLINKIQKKQGWGIKLITLSTSNCVDVDSGIKHLVASFRKMRNRALWQTKVDGGAFVIEITGRPGSWHPHIHAIVYSVFIPWKTLWRDWKQCSGGTAVWISSSTPAAATSHIVKYVSKTAVPLHLQLQLSTELRAFRLFQRFGSWHRLKLPSRLYDHPCEKCGKSDWLYDYIRFNQSGRRSPGGRSPPTVPTLSPDDIAWRSPRIWPCPK